MSDSAKEGGTRIPHYLMEGLQAPRFGQNRTALNSVIFMREQRAHNCGVH